MLEPHFPGALATEDEVFAWACAVQAGLRLVYRNHNDAAAKASLQAARLKLVEACARLATECGPSWPHRQMGSILPIPL